MFMKSNLLISLVICLFSILTVSAKSDFTADGIEYTILSDRENCVEVAIGYSYKGDLVVPVKVANEADGKEYTVVGIGVNAFSYTAGQLKSVALPSTLEYIADKAFRGARGLVSMEIPSGLQTIGESAFNGCTKLPAFTVAEGNKYFSAKDGVLFNKDQTKLLIYPMAKEGEEYTIPDGVTELEKNAFENVTLLKKIVFDKDLTVIGDYAFNNCNNLKTLDFSELNIKSLGVSAFHACKMLTELDFSKSTFPSVGKSLFYNNNNLVKLWLPATVTEFGEYAFNGLKSLEELHMQAEKPAQFTTVGSTFYPINNELTTLYVPKGCKDAYAADPAYAGFFKDIVEEDITTGIHAALSSAKAGITVSNGKIQFSSTAKNIHIYNMSGNEVLRLPAASVVNVSSLSKGVYVATAVVDGKSVSAKVCVGGF